MYYKNVLKWHKLVPLLRGNTAVLFPLAASSLPLSGTSFGEAMHWVTGETLQMIFGLVNVSWGWFPIWFTTSLPVWPYWHVDK